MSSSAAAPLLDATMKGEEVENPARSTLLAYVIGNAGAILCGLLAAYLALLHGHSISDSTIKTGDFIAYYSGAHLVATGHGGLLYDFHALKSVQTAVLRPLAIQGGLLMPYLYPPFLGLLQAPLGALPFDAAYAIWLACNGVLLVVTLYFLERHARLTGRAAAIFRFASICSLPVLLALFNGQTSILLLALLALSLVAARGGHDLTAGIALAGVLIKPQYVVPVLLVFAIRRRWRALVAWAASECCLIGLTFPVLGAAIVTSYIGVLKQASSWTDQFGYAATRNNSLAGFTQLLFSPHVAGAVRYVLCLAALAALAWCAYHSADLDLPFGLAVVVGLLVSPHVLTHDLVLLLLPVAVALRYRTQASWGLQTLLVAGYLMVTAGYWLVYRLHVQLSVVAMAGLSVWMAVALARSIRSGTARKREGWIA